MKRITAINGNRVINPNDGTILTEVINAPGAEDDHANWPSNYLTGEVDGGIVRPGDTIEYTVYFLNAETGDALNLRICDRLTPSQSFRFGAYGTTGQDVQLRFGASTNPVLSLTAINDSRDRTQWLIPGANVPTTCNLQGPNNNGTLLLDVTGAAGTGIPTLETLPGSTGAGQPHNSYGFFRFMTTVD